jgi:putative colanic acid biosynthesis UDP-glucose lipid carrier transferase
MAITHHSEKQSYLDKLSPIHLNMEELRDRIMEAGNPPTLLMRVSKELMDKLVVLIALPLLLPLLAVIAVAIKLESPGSVFFRQRRTGMNGEIFNIYKFRTMTETASEDLKASQSKRHDLRHTKVGRFLRRTSLDELPQLLNVLKGEMSIIGPRPHARYHDELFQSANEDYVKRFRVKPGITGLAQVNGCRGFIENAQQLHDRTWFDNEYIEHWSLAMEVKIFFKTFWVVLIAKQAH